MKNRSFQASINLSICVFLSCRFWYGCNGIVVMLWTSDDFQRLPGEMLVKHLPQVEGWNQVKKFVQAYMSA